MLRGQFLTVAVKSTLSYYIIQDLVFQAPSENSEYSRPQIPVGAEGLTQKAVVVLCRTKARSSQRGDQELSLSLLPSSLLLLLKLLRLRLLRLL